MLLLSTNLDSPTATAVRAPTNCPPRRDQNQVREQGQQSTAAPTPGQGEQKGWKEQQ